MMEMVEIRRMGGLMLYDLNRGDRTTSVIEIEDIILLCVCIGKKKLLLRALGTSLEKMRFSFGTNVVQPKTAPR